MLATETMALRPGGFLTLLLLAAAFAVAAAGSIRDVKLGKMGGETIVEEYIDVDGTSTLERSSPLKDAPPKADTPTRGDQPNRADTPPRTDTVKVVRPDLTDDADLLQDGSGSGAELDGGQPQKENLTFSAGSAASTATTTTTTTTTTTPSTTITTTTPSTTTTTTTTTTPPTTTTTAATTTTTTAEKTTTTSTIYPIPAEVDINFDDFLNGDVKEGGEHSDDEDDSTRRDHGNDVSFSDYGYDDEDDEYDEDEEDDDEDDDFHLPAPQSVSTLEQGEISNAVPESAGAPVYGHWSPWLQSGDVDIRFRPCVRDCQRPSPPDTCGADRVEVRACAPPLATTINNTVVMGPPRCQGLDVRDVPNADLTFAITTEESHCRYSLYDLKRRRAVFSGWDLARVAASPSVRHWCSKPEAFLLLRTGLQACERDINDLCKMHRTCKRSKQTKAQRSVGDFAHECWRKFLYGGRIPAGLSDTEARPYFICQRLAAEGRLGAAFGGKRAFYGTIYDTRRRLPVVSLTRLSRLGDDSWPQTSFMVDAGLIEEESSYPWASRRRQPGMLELSDLGQCDLGWNCRLGTLQALPVDYHQSGYRMAHLLPPELAGPDVRARLSTFTLTNVAPMHPSLYSQWRTAVLAIRRHALNDCGVPLDSHDKGGSERGSGASLYLAAGAVPSQQPEETIGHGVNVPFLFWMAGCCVREGETRSWAIYARNQANGQVLPAPVLQLELLLQDLYKSRQRHARLTLFPGKKGRCGELANDASLTLRF